MDSITFHNHGNLVEMIIEDIDKQLLVLLSENARRPVAELARALNLSRSTVKDHIDRLENKGVIKGYSVILDDEMTKGYVSAHVMITTESGKPAHIIRYLQKISQIKKAYAVSGIYDLIAIVQAESTGELDEVLDMIRELEGIKDTLTSVVLSTKFDR